MLLELAREPLVEGWDNLRARGPGLPSEVHRYVLQVNDFFRDEFQACGVVFPLASATSTCRNSVTICSGLYFFIGIPASLQSEFSLTPAGTKDPALVNADSRFTTYFVSQIHPLFGAASKCGVSRGC
jgi:hypothetical protein